jgi:hypothetical protein
MRVEFPGIRAIWSVLVPLARVFLEAVSGAEPSFREEERVRWADSSALGALPSATELFPEM